MKTSFKVTHSNRPDPQMRISMESEGGAKVEITAPANDLAEVRVAMDLAFGALKQTQGKSVAQEAFRDMAAQLTEYQTTMLRTRRRSRAAAGKAVRS